MTNKNVHTASKAMNDQHKTTFGNCFKCSLKRTTDYLAEGAWEIAYRWSFAVNISTAAKCDKIYQDIVVNTR